MVKKLLSLAVAIGISASAFAQYYYIPGGTGNPGGLNSDVDEPLGANQGWTSVIGPSQASAVWSAKQAIPFPFQFNGGLVDSFMVSSSGIVTFSKNPGTVPAYGTSVTLPSPSLPDSSIAVLGIQGTGSNDGVGTKVFGTAPNRQLYISFLSFSIPGASNFLYYAVVLEESSNRIYLVDQRAGTPLTGGISMGLQIDGSLGFPISGSPNLGTMSGSDPSPSDNVYYTYVFGQQPNLDFSMERLNIPEFTTVSAGALDIAGDIKNVGLDTLVSFDINYSVNGGATVTTPFSGRNIVTFGTFYFIATPWVPTSPGSYEVKVWVSNLNGNPDQFNANDTLSTTIEVLAFETSKKVVIEEGTGTWCGWCPRGAVAMEYMTNNHSDKFIGIAVHNGDPMTVTPYDNGAAFTGFPGMNVDRASLGVGVSTASMEAYTLARFNDITSPANISIIDASIDHATGDVSVTAEVHAATTLIGDYRLAVVVVEDSVTGTGSGWGQVNYYSGGGNGTLSGAGHDWHNAPSTVPGKDMYYDHVGRVLLGGYNGRAGSLPDTMYVDQKYTDVFQANVASKVDRYVKLKFVALVLGPNGEIVNAEEVSMKPGVSVQENTFESAVFPNPATDFLTVRLAIKGQSDVAIQVYDMMGKQVLNKFNTLNAGTYNLPVDLSTLPAGIYNVNLDVNGERVTHKIIVQ